MNDVPRDMDGNPKFDEFGASVNYHFEGRTIGYIEVSSDKLPKHNANDGQLVYPSAKLTWSEPLNANIINVDGWLNEHWKDSMPATLDLEHGEFFVEWGKSNLHISASTEEIVAAAKTRAHEDNIHPVYVLGSWTYLARTSDHVSGAPNFRRAFDFALRNCDNVPSDATTETFEGKRA
jgi:hypothetical protein